MFRKLLALGLLVCLLSGSAAASERPHYITQYTNGSREDKRIAITIDDWYEPEMLPEFLDVANEYGCKLTLYPIGINVRPKEGPFWQRAIDFQYLADEGTIDDRDLDLFHYAETAEEAWEMIQQFHAK